MIICYIVFGCCELSGEANFLGGVASLKGVEGFDTEVAKKRFFEIYLSKVIDVSSLQNSFKMAKEKIFECCISLSDHFGFGIAVNIMNIQNFLQFTKPDSGIGFPGALELITEVRYDESGSSLVFFAFPIGDL